jgi:hypothetical protein
VIHDNPIFIRDAKLLPAIAAKQRLASVGFPEFTAAGGPVAYGVNFRDMYRRADTSAFDPERTFLDLDQSGIAAFHKLLAVSQCCIS